MTCFQTITEKKMRDTHLDKNRTLLETCEGILKSDEGDGVPIRLPILRFRETEGRKVGQESREVRVGGKGQRKFMKFVLTEGSRKAAM
jgi:hypothetical protein